MGKPQSKPTTTEEEQVIATQIGYQNRMDVHNTMVLGQLGQLNTAIIVFVGIFGIAIILYFCRYLNAQFNKRVDRRAQAIAFKERNISDV